MDFQIKINGLLRIQRFTTAAICRLDAEAIGSFLAILVHGSGEFTLCHFPVLVHLSVCQFPVKVVHILLLVRCLTCNTLECLCHIKLISVRQILCHQRQLTAFCVIVLLGSRRIIQSETSLYRDRRIAFLYFYLQCYLVGRPLISLEHILCFVTDIGICTVFDRVRIVDRDGADAIDILHIKVLIIRCQTLRRFLPEYLFIRDLCAFLVGLQSKLYCLFRIIRVQCDRGRLQSRCGAWFVGQADLRYGIDKFH